MLGGPFGARKEKKEMENAFNEDEIRKLNIYDMSFMFTSMARVFKKQSKEIILLQYKNTVSKIENVLSKEEFEIEHLNFCKWFCQNIKLSKIENGLFDRYASYGQVVKVLDIMLKVEFYYCNRDAEIAKYLHAAIDTPILNYLKKQYPDSTILAKTIYEIEKQEYSKLQEIIKKEIADKYQNKITPVQYDDIKWRELNRKYKNRLTTAST